VILLDTNICIHIINAKPPAVLQRFRDYRMGEIGLCRQAVRQRSLRLPRQGDSVPRTPVVRPESICSTVSSSN